MSTAAVFPSPTWAWTWPTNAANASSAHRSGPPGQRNGYAIGTRYTSPANGPKRCL